MTSTPDGASAVAETARRNKPFNSRRAFWWGAFVGLLVGVLFVTQGHLGGSDTWAKIGIIATCTVVLAVYEVFFGALMSVTPNNGRLTNLAFLTIGIAWIACWQYSWVKWLALPTAFVLLIGFLLDTEVAGLERSKTPEVRSGPSTRRGTMTIHPPERH